MAKDSYFEAELYEVRYSHQDDNCLGHVKITGRKTKPSKRLVFYVQDLKVIKATIVLLKRSQIIEIAVTRLNHLKSFGEVRLHTDAVLPAGVYNVELSFELSCDRCRELLTMGRVVLDTHPKYFPCCSKDDVESKVKVMSDDH